MRIKLVLLSLMLASCSSLWTPYKMEIRQGNVVTPEMRGKLKLGMTKQQVRFVMGSPTISDPFHANRWDYAYRLERQGKVVEKQGMTLHFEGDNLVRIEEGGQAVETAPAKAE